MFDGANLTVPRKTQSQVHPMPVEQPYFKWRLRTTLRQIVNAPCPAPDVLPSVYVQLGWSLYENAEPQEHNQVMSVMIDGNQFPDFN